MFPAMSPYGPAIMAMPMPPQAQTPSLPNSYYYNDGRLALARSAVSNQFGLAASIARAEQTLLGKLIQTGAVSMDRNGFNIGKTISGQDRNGLPFLQTLARSLNANGLSEAITKANPLAKETLAAGKTRDGFTTLAYSKQTPLGEQARALIFTPFGVVLSGAGTGIFQEDKFSRKL